jgi:hypothetical protein
MLEYKVVESSTVTDEDLQRILNEQVSAGWRFDGMQFAMRESSKRPAMAFLLFTRGSERSVDADPVAAVRAALAAPAIDVAPQPASKKRSRKERAP